MKVKSDMNKNNIVINLSIVIAILTLIATAIGAFSERLYRDNDFLVTVWQSTDLMVLILIVPLFVISIYFSKKDSLWAYLILLGLLDFTLYNYGYYLFGAAFNWFFLIYLLLYVLSAAAIIIALINIDIQAVAEKFNEKIPVKWIAGFMLFVSISLTAVYTMMTIGFIATGNVPVIVERSGHPTNVVFAMDLSLVVPAFTLTGIWLWKKKPWGYVLAAISLVKGALYNAVLSYVTVQVANNGYPESMGELPLWGFFTIASLISCVLMFRGLKKQ
jgi:hypothetical protein